VTLASTVILGSESHRTHDHISMPDGSGSLQSLLRARIPSKLYIETQFVPHRKHVSATKPNRFMLLATQSLFIVRTIPNRLRSSYVLKLVKLSLCLTN
jgi:hypothetical protein